MFQYFKYYLDNLTIGKLFIVILFWRPENEFCNDEFGLVVRST